MLHSDKSFAGYPARCYIDFFEAKRQVVDDFSARLGADSCIEVVLLCRILDLNSIERSVSAVNLLKLH